MERNMEGVRQTTLVLPHFDYEIPALYVADTEAPYFPVSALCDMLGLKVESYLARWRQLLLWGSARKLPLRTPRGTRMVWCLHAGALLGWYGCFSWKKVLSERREQLRRSADALLNASEQAYWSMQLRHRETRRLLFGVLTAYADHEEYLTRFSAVMQTHLPDVHACVQWEEFIAKGRTVVKEVTDQARRMLQQQADVPVLDVVVLDDGAVQRESFSLPLFPFLQEDELKMLYQALERVNTWHEQYTQFLATHRIVWDGENKKWYVKKSR